MKIRELELKDIPYMLEWMKDPEINKFFRFESKDINEDTVKIFVESKSENNFHYAIVDDNDEYLGTISLKDIEMSRKTAEFAIALRSKAIGKGVGRWATEKILNEAFNAMEIKQICLNVLPCNKRAISLYEKVGFKFDCEEEILIKGKYQKISWFNIKRSEYESV